LTRYFKTVYELVYEAAHELGKNCNEFTDVDVIRFVRNKYPDCPFSDNSFRMHLLGLSKNNPSAEKMWPNLHKKAFLYRVKGYRFKLWDCVEKQVGEELDMAVEEPVRVSLTLEHDLEEFLSRNLGAVEEGLKLVERQKQIPIGRIDILAEDKNGNLVVMELKAGLADEKSLTQLLSYLSYFKDNVDKNARGLLIANDFSIKVKYAVKLVPDVKLIKYKVKFEFEEISTNQE